MRVTNTLSTLTLTLTLLLGGLLPAQAKTLLYVSKYDSTSLDSTAGLLANARPFDIFAVTPGAGATAFPWLPAAGISATIGDPDNDGKVAEFSGLPHNSFSLTGTFIKDADRKKADPRLVYWTVRVTNLTPPKIDVFSGTTTHTVRPGDFVRLTENGEAEFFIKQEHIMTAAGPQPGAYVKGAGALCQLPNGDLIYMPPNGITASGTRVAGGHYLNSPKSTWVNDGTFVRIPNSAITYDKNGNVSSVKGSSAIEVVGETSTGANVPSLRTMVQNSGAVDGGGLSLLTQLTFVGSGVDIDPNGGTFLDWQGTSTPNLIFTYDNPISGFFGQGSWKGTIFSTAKNTQGQHGSIAVINGVTMGATTGSADGAWTGLKNASGSASAPLLRGLALIDVALKSKAPYGNATLQAANDGIIKLASDPNVRLALQGPLPAFPSSIGVGLGPALGKRPSSFNMGAVWKGFTSLHVLSPIIIFGLGGSDLKGQTPFVFKLPNNPLLLGLNVTWQTLSASLSGPMLGNPVVTEIR